MSTAKSQYYRKQVRDLRIEHREFLRVRAEVHSYLSCPMPGRVVMVVGPTRTGKSYIREDIAPLLVDQKMIDPRFQHLVTVEAAATIDGYMSMKHFTLRALIAMRHPFVAHLVEGYQDISYIARLRLGESELRLMLEGALAARKTLFMNIEEAHHLTRTRGRRRAGEALDTLKNIGNVTGTIMNMWGGVELLKVGLASAHLNGRLRVFPFPAYEWNKRGDVKEFTRILELLESVLPLKKGFSIVDHRESMHHGSVGTTGLLCEWTDAALALMGARGSDFLTKEHFEASRFEDQIEAIEMEVKLSKKLFKRVRLLEEGNNARPRFRARSPEDKVKPFTRKPTRDPVGPKNPPNKPA